MNDGLEILRRRYVTDEPDGPTRLAEAEQDAELASRIHDLRTQAGLTRRELAARVEVRRSAISRLEDDDYREPTLSLLRRIARALGHRVEIRFVRAKGKRTG